MDLLSYSQEEKVMGKKVSDFLKSEILSSVFYLAFGLCLLLVPDQTVNIICKIVFGLVMIASGNFVRRICRFSFAVNIRTRPQPL